MRFSGFSVLLLAAACTFPEVGFDDAGQGGAGGVASSGGSPTTGGAAPSVGGFGGSGAGASGGGAPPATGGAGGGTPSCIDNDGDLYVAASSDPACLQDPRFKTVFDCYDENQNAHPGQTNFYVIDRGDNSYDYDCDSAEKGLYALTCNTSTKSLVVNDGTEGCGAVWPRQSVKVAVACVDDGSDTQACH